MMRLRLVPRAQPSRAMLFVAPLLAVALTLMVGLAVFAWLGQNPVRAFRVFFIDPVSDMNGVSELLLKASPLCLIALGLAIGFRASIWNIGAEGQMYMGGMFATGLAIAFRQKGGPWLLPAMILAGALGGALWASIAAALRAQFHANEILVTLMLTYVADLVVKYLVFGPWQDPQGNNFPITLQFSDNALFPLFASWGWERFEGTRMNASVFLTLAAIPLAWLFMERSFLGFQLQVTGLAPAAARYAGFGERRMVWLALLIGGAAAGLAGVSEVAGPIGQLNDRWQPLYGFTAIIVAALGRLHALRIVLAALGELVVERSGVLHLGLEGMMLLGALAGFAAVAHGAGLGPAVLAAMAAGIIAALGFGFITLTLQANQVAAGLSLTILGAGVSAFLGRQYVGFAAPVSFGDLPIPLLSRIPLLGPSLFSLNLLGYATLVLLGATAWFLYRTRARLALRSIGESPVGARSLRLHVNRVRYAAVAFGGAMAGLAGCYYAVAQFKMWQEGLTSGNGWTALALVVVATWRPLRVALGALLFGGVSALRPLPQAIGRAGPRL